MICRKVHMSFSRGRCIQGQLRGGNTRRSSIRRGRPWCSTSSSRYGCISRSSRDKLGSLIYELNIIIVCGQGHPWRIASIQGGERLQISHRMQSNIVRSGALCSKVGNTLCKPISPGINRLGRLGLVRRRSGAGMYIWRGAAGAQLIWLALEACRRHRRWTGYALRARAGAIT